MTGMKSHALIFFLFLVTACNTPAHNSPSVFSDKPVHLTPPTLLEDVVHRYPTDSDQARAAQFLLNNLPMADAWSMSQADFRANLEYAFVARAQLPWGNTVPWEIFLHYVLPHRGTQEPFQPHRPMLFKTLAPLCADASDMEEALSRVGSWCARQAEYRPTSRRDLGVQSILDSGYGRCEETNILFMAAARAVCLPVRQAMVPWWQHGDGNHAWIEAWTPSGWKFLESSTEFSDLETTWFAAQRSRMPRVVAAAFGHPDDKHVYRTGAGYALVDSTANYTRTRQIRILVSNGTQPAAGHEVYASVYSMGGLRPVARITTDSTGRADATLGPGTFLLSCTAGQGLNWLVTDFVNATSVFLDCATERPLPENIRLQYPPPLADTYHPIISAELQTLRTNRPKKWTALLHTLPTSLQHKLAMAGDTVPAWLRLLDLHADMPSLQDYVLVLDDKDLLQAAPDRIPGEISLALQARTHRAKIGHIYTDIIFQEHVLSQRLYLEPWSPWRTELWTWLEPLQDCPLSEQIAAIQAVLDTLQILPPAYFGPPPTPGQMLRARQCFGARDKAVLAAAALRTLGIPARLQPDFELIEYLDGSTWRQWDMSPEPVPPMGTQYVMGHDLQPLRDFSVAMADKGFLRTLDDLIWSGDGNSLSCTLPAGSYVLVTASRGPGQTDVALRRFTINPGKSSTILLKARY